MLGRIQKTMLALAGLAALALGGSALAGAASNTGTNSTPSTSGTTTQPRPSIPPHGGTAHENAEKPVTGDAADKAKAAAEKSVGSGSTATEVTTDFTGDGYEVTVKKSDGSTVEVHLDKSFNVIQHRGGPCGHHGFGPDGGWSSGSSSGSSDSSNTTTTSATVGA